MDEEKWSEGCRGKERGRESWKAGNRKSSNVERANGRPDRERINGAGLWVCVCGDASFGIPIVQRFTFCSSTDVAFRFRFHFHSLLGCSELDILSTFSYGFLLQEIEQLIAYLSAVRFFLFDSAIFGYNSNFCLTLLRSPSAYLAVRVFEIQHWCHWQTSMKQQ